MLQMVIHEYGIYQNAKSMQKTSVMIINDSMAMSALEVIKSLAD